VWFAEGAGGERVSVARSSVGLRRDRGKSYVPSVTRRCYAERLGTCEGKLTREHFVSRSLLADLERTFMAEGLLPGDVGATTAASAGSVASRVLCSAHNSALSDVDSHVVPFLSASRRFDHELNSAASAPAAASVDGYMLERWLVKALLGLVARPGSTSTLSAQTHDRLVAVAFGLDRLAPPWGVHLDISPERPMASLHDFSLVALCNPEGECRAATFSSGSIRWLFALGKSGLPDHTYRPHSVELRSSTATRRLHLDWPTGIGSGMAISLDRQTFDAATVPEIFTPLGSMQVTDARASLNRQ
jgi:hypothetical protein